MSDDNIKDVYLSVVIPVFNEAKVLAQTISDLNEYLTIHGSLLEVIVVNDNSTDSSLEIIKSKLCKNQNVRVVTNGARQGKALTVRDGIAIAKGEYVLFMDADLSVPLKEIDKILGCIKDGHNDVVIGVRDSRDCATLVVRPLYRKIISRIYNTLCNLLFFKYKILDVGCGFKAFKREIALDLFSNLYIKSWVFDVEILFKALKSNYKIKEVFVNWTFKGRSSLNMYKDLIVAFCELLRLKIFLMKYKRD